MTKTKTTKLLLGIPAYSPDCKLWFLQSFVNTSWPKHIEMHFQCVLGTATASACQILARSAVENYDYLLLAATDIGWEPNAVRLLLDAGKDVIGGWAGTRYVPFSLTTVERYDEETCNFIRFKEPGKGIQPAFAIGGGFVLMRVAAMKRIPSPWFYGPEMFHPKQAKMVSEDYYFGLKAAKYGVESWVHWDVPLKHHAEGLYSQGGRLHSIK